MNLTLGFSPCPNDTFIFDALVNKKIDTEGLDFETVIEDVETLNRLAFDNKLDITKLSFPSFFQNTDKYLLLRSGAALGKGVGPVLISKKAEGISNIDQGIMNIEPALPEGMQRMSYAEVINSTIALPGKNTTANLLFSFAFPEARKKRFMIFSDIEYAVLNEETDLGVIIHENRFTYQQKGLYKVMDLGENWETKMKLPVPLGCIAINKDIDRHISLTVEKLIRKSIEFAQAAYPKVPDYVKQHSAAMEEDVMRKHIELYVNDFSLDPGEEGKKAIDALYNVFNSLHQPVKTNPLSSPGFLS